MAVHLSRCWKTCSQYIICTKESKWKDQMILLVLGPCGPCVWWCSKSALGCLDRGKWFYFFNLSSVVLSFWKSCLWNILELGSLMFFEWPWSACSELGHQAVAVSKRKFRYAITWHDVRVEQTMNRRMGQAGYLWRRGGNATSEARISSKNVSPAAEYVEGAPSWDLYLRKKVSRKTEH